MTSLRNRLIPSLSAFLTSRTRRDAARNFHALRRRLSGAQAGLWGAPTHRVNGKPAHWGQDRLWALEEDIP